MSDIHQDIEPHDVAFGQVYRGIAKSSPSRLQGGIDIMIPDINPDIEFQNVRSHVMEDDFRPRIGDEVLVIFDNNNQPWVISWAPGIPVGGSVNQVLSKNSPADYDASWKSVGTVPVGGAAGQVLTKNTTTNFDTGWTSPSSGIPTVVNGQWLKGVGGAAVWAAITPADAGLPKITTSLMSGGPPASPSDGDQWVARNVLTNNGGTYVNWKFSYDASFGVWRFIGGTPVNASTTAFVSPASPNAWAALAPSWTAVRSGQYLCTFSGRAVLNGAAITESFWLAIAFNGPGVTSTGIYHGGIFQTNQASLGVTARGVGGVNAGQTISAGFYVTNILIGLLGEIHITPIYVT